MDQSSNEDGESSGYSSESDLEQKPILQKKPRV